MSFGVCLHAPRDRFMQNQWDYVLLHWRPDKIYVIGDAWHSRPMSRAEPFCGEGDIVIMAPASGRHVRGRRSLADYSHREGVTYLFGADHEDLTIEGETVFIPTATDDEMHAFVAAAVTLYDRAVKRG